MLGYIRGEIVEKQNGTVLLQAGNVGFEISVSENTFYSVGDVGATARLYTFLQVKEDGLNLFGFSTKEEKQLFMLLTGVSGIGCRMALNVMSNCKTSELASAIVNADSHKLSSVKGIGKKTADRIILELREKLGGLNVVQGSGGFDDDCVYTLVSLGLSRNEAAEKVKAAREHGVSSAEEVLNYALKNLR